MPRIRRLATEFACQWLHIYDFDRSRKRARSFSLNSPSCAATCTKSRSCSSPTCSKTTVGAEHPGRRPYLRQRPVGQVLRHCGPDTSSGAPASPTALTTNGWRRVDGVRRYGRGGILGLATTLAKQSGASRTSPILRGNWVSEVLLGEKLPKPPKDVPRLPESETATDGLTVRQLIERHISDTRCSSCHRQVRPVRLRARRVRRHRPPPQPRSRRPHCRHQDAAPRRKAKSTVSTACGTIWRDSARRLCSSVLPQAAGLCAGPRGSTFRRTAAG